MARAGVALYAISYDPVDALATFTAKHGITYTMLSDDGSRVIRALGMLDEDLDRHHAEFGRPTRDEQRGVPYPAIFLLDEQGVVARKQFHPRYRIRDTGPGLLAALLGVVSEAHGPEAAGEARAVRLRAYLDSPTYHAYQQLQLIVEITVSSGWHLYTTPIPSGYVPLGVEITPLPGLTVSEAVWPAGRPFRVEGPDEEFSVLDGVVRGRVPLMFAAATPNGAGGGDLRVEGTVRYQACSETECLPPGAISFTVSAKEAPLVE